MNGKPWSVATLIKQHPRIALDANVLIYVLDGHEDLGRRAAAVVDAIDAGDVVGSMATIAQVEILAGAARSGDAALFERQADEIRSLGLRLISLTSEVAEEAGWLRGSGALEAADAIHVACAKAAGATALVTNDRRIRTRTGLEVAYLADLELVDANA